MMNDYIAETGYAQSMENVVQPYLLAHRSERSFPGYDGQPLYAVIYRAEAPRAAVAICHGFTESCRKFDELAYYFLRHNFTVFIAEHRGHGHSFRRVSDLMLTHIDRFEEYVQDWECFMDGVVRAEWPGPLFLFAHSMGGAIATLYMQRHPDVIARAVLSSPMIGLVAGGIPAWLGKLVCLPFILSGNSQKRSFTSPERPEADCFETSCATSRARYEDYVRKRRADPYLSNRAPTYGWVYQAMGVTRKLLKRGGPERIQTPILLFSAENDALVKREPQEKLVRRLPHAQFRLIKGAKHEIYLSADDVLVPYLEELFRFLAL